MIVRPSASDANVIRLVASEDRGVRTGTTRDRIVTSTARDCIRTSVTIDDVVTRTTNDVIIAIRTQNRNRNRADNRDIIARGVARQNQTVESDDTPISPSSKLSVSTPVTVSTSLVTVFVIVIVRPSAEDANVIRLVASEDRVSEPAPPVIVSPAPPVIVSAPALPSMMSSPEPPTMSSSPSAPEP